MDRDKTMRAETVPVDLDPAKSVGARTAGAKTAGAGTAGAKTKGTRTAGAETAGAKTAGAKTAGAGTAGAKTAGARTAGAKTAGAGTAGAKTVRAKTVRALVDAKVVGIIRVHSEEVALRIGEALVSGGLRAVEVTFTVPGAERVIEMMRDRWPDMLVGAGTVTDAATARRAADVGARYIVSPGLEPRVVEVAHDHDLPALPGVMTPTETMAALRLGADMLKLFPASVVGPAYLKALRGPFPEALWCPTGGVYAENFAEWLAAGAALVGVGGPLLGDVAKTHDYEALEQRARQWAALAKRHS